MKVRAGFNICSLFWVFSFLGSIFIDLAAHFFSGFDVSTFNFGSSVIPWTGTARHENTDIAVKSFELSQNLITKWDTADFSARRRILEIMCLNLTLDGASLDIEWRKPFDLIAEGLNLNQSGEDRI